MRLHCDGYVNAARNPVFSRAAIQVAFGNVFRVDHLTTPSPNDSVAVFAPTATGALGAKVAMALGMSLSPHEEQEFTGREYKARPLQSVRDRSVYVVQSLFGDPRGSANDRLCQLLFLSLGLFAGGRFGLFRRLDEKYTAVIPGAFLIALSVLRLF